jgi:hypothetical protein
LWRFRQLFGGGVKGGPGLLRRRPNMGDNDTLCRADLRSALSPIYVGGG